MIDFICLRKQPAAEINELDNIGGQSNRGHRFKCHYGLLWEHRLKFNVAFLFSKVMR